MEEDIHDELMERMMPSIIEDQAYAMGQDLEWSISQIQHFVDTGLGDEIEDAAEEDAQNILALYKKKARSLTKLLSSLGLSFEEMSEGELNDLAHYMYMEAVGHGVRWSDYYNGGELPSVYYPSDLTHNAVHNAVLDAADPE